MSAARADSSRKAKNGNQSTNSKHDSVAARSAASSETATSSCRQRGPEAPAYVYAALRQRVDTYFQVCGGSSHLRVSLHSAGPTAGGIPLFEGAIPSGSNPNPLSFMLPPLPSGVHLVMWAYAVAGDHWDIVAELHVEGVPRFRKINSSTDSIPANVVWTYLEVI